MSDQHSVDFLQKKYDIPSEREVRARVSRTGRALVSVFAVTALVGVFFSYRIAQVTHGDESDVGSLSLFSTFSSSLARLVTSGDKALTGEESDRVNFLLLGVGGEGHDGPQLSDTIIFGSLQPSTHETGLVSIPRDLTVNIPGYGYRKINHANAYGEMAGDGEGLELAKDVVGDIMGEDIHYVVRVDFDGFATLIDELGGIDILVENSFTDYQYPEYSGSPTYQTIAFDAGWQHMDGDTALQFARSRHGNNGEGTDFARAARQQKILLAVKDRALSLGALLNPGKMTRLLDTLNDHIDTNLSFWEMVKLAKYIPSIDTQHLSMTVLDTGAGSPLYSSTINGAYVILPRNDDWSDLHAIADNIFTVGTTPDEGPSQAVAPAPEDVRVEIQNGTTVSGLASITAQRLEGSPFAVVKIGNATERSFARTTIYDLTNGRKATELAALKEFLGADVVMASEGWIYANTIVPTELTPSEDLGPELATIGNIDFLIIVGEDAASLAFR